MQHPRHRNPWNALIGIFALTLALPTAGACGGDDDSGTGNGNNNTSQQSPVCGNGQVEPGEQCDDGAANNDLAPDACRTTCRSPHCGDGVTDSDETARDQRDWERNVAFLYATGGPSDTGVYHLVTAFDTIDATMDGFVLTRGAALGDSLHAYGGGILALRSRLRLANLRIMFCEASAGGAIYAFDSELTLTDSFIDDNRGGNIEGGPTNALEGSTLRAERCHVANNRDLGTSRGGAVTVIQSTAILTDSFFYDNHAREGGAIYGENGSAVTVSRCVIAGNRADEAGGAMSFWGADFSVSSSLLAGNTATDAGGAHSAQAPRAASRPPIPWRASSRARASL